MQKILPAFIFAIILGIGGTASAFVYTDNFYGTVNDGNYIDLDKNESVALTFDITDSGYDPLTQEIVAATLDFTISSADAADETIRITAGVYDGDVLLYEKEYDLGDLVTSIFNDYQTASISLDLDALGLLDYVQDGTFTTIVLSVDEPGWWDWDSDFRLDAANFTAEAYVKTDNTSAVVPEPATLLLFGTGIAGLASLGRRKKH